MQEREFNLLYEPWIRVLKQDCAPEDVSLLTLFEKAQDYRELGGELPTQDFAILRLLLAILHAVFERKNAEGHDAPIRSIDDALDRWESLWRLGRFPSRVIADYLQRYEDRFWLFDAERPFYQVPEAEAGTVYTAAKLNGELSESSNKVRLFPSRTGTVKSSICFPEAARWLIYVNGYDDTSSKPKQKGLPSPGAGWLGKLGMLIAVGNNLFETLMLNLVLLKDGQEPWGQEHPLWERDKAKSAERTQIACPDNQSELLTLQSRRLLLKREGKAVTGYMLLGGDFFDKTLSSSEQMTVWVRTTKPDEVPRIFQPKRHDPAKQMWRDFSTIFTSEDDSVRQPGIVRWLSWLKSNGLSSSKQLRFQIASVQYGDKDFFVTDVFSDSLALQSDLLTSLGKRWTARIDVEVEKCGQIAYVVGTLAKDLFRSSHNESKKNKPNEDAKAAVAKAQFYYRVDIPFRQWLQSIDPTKEFDEKEALFSRWRETACSIALSLGKEMVKETGLESFSGHPYSNGRLYTAPQSFNWFLINLAKCKRQEGK